MKYLNIIILLAALCGSGISQSTQYEVQVAFPGVSITQPVDLQHAGDGSNRLFVVEQAGRIWVFENDSQQAAAAVFLDIRDRVDDSSSEEGLLGLAFHPDYAQNGYFYVNYTANNPNRTLISRFQVTPGDSNLADPGSETVIITLPKPYANHNAGALAFGPQDGYLYITAGDGGQGGDPLNSGQDRTTLLGAILRIDIDQTAGSLNYAIPTDNPFAGNTQGYREEIYAYGLRNPWRMSFDPVTGWLWVGDVGQNLYEEIDVIESGKNYGWNIMEATHCYPPGSSCDTTGLTLPVWEYSHSLGVSVTGGYVYRGPSLPGLTGKYIYADFGSGRIWALSYDGSAPAQNELLIDTQLNIASFGVDQNNELYICAFDGKIYRLQTPNGMGGEAGLPGGFELGQNYPNPFNPGTVIRYQLSVVSDVKLAVYDLLGREVRVLAEGRQAAGPHEAAWDGRDGRGTEMAGGVYYYRLTVDGRAMTRRMVLVR